MRQYFGLKSSSLHSKRSDISTEDEVKAQLFRQFKLPENFYQRILELEQVIDRQKENVDQPVLQQLMALYSQAIEYYGFIDDVDRCADLNMRMQGILVRPYILDSLSKINEQKEQEQKTGAKQQKIVLKSTPKTPQDPNSNQANAQSQNEQQTADISTEDEAEVDSETTDSEDEEEQKQEEEKPVQEEDKQQQETKKEDSTEAQDKENDMLKEIEADKKLEQNTPQPVDNAEKKRQSKALKKQEPVKKTHIKRTVGAIEENHKNAIELIKNGLNSQTENVQDRLRKRKLDRFKRQNSRVQNGENQLNQTELYNSPNLSQIVDTNNNTNLQVSQNMLSPEDDSIMDQNILNNLEDDLDPDDNLDEDEDAEENEEHLYEFERKQEEYLEEFLEMAYTKKHEVVEEFKAFSKKNKLKKDVEKERIKQISKEIDANRKKGTKDIKAQFNQILEEDELTLLGKLNAIQDPEIKDKLKKIMDLALSYDTEFKVEEPAE